MVEAELLEFVDKIEEEIIKEEKGFVQKVTSSDEDVADKIISSSKKIEKKIASYNSDDVMKEPEPLRTLLNVLVQNKEKVSYSYDEFDNGAIRVFETEDESLLEGLLNTADVMMRHVPKDVFLHEDTVTSFILNAEKPVMVFFIYPEQEDSKKVMEKINDYVIDFDKVEVRAINVKESAEMDEIFKVGMETPVVVLYKLENEEIKEVARLTGGQVSEENIVKMSNLEV